MSLCEMRLKLVANGYSPNPLPWQGTHTERIGGATRAPPRTT